MRNSRERRRAVCPSGRGPREVHRGRRLWDAEFERETWISQKQKIGEKNRSLDRPPEGPEKTGRADVRAMALKRNLKNEDDRHRRRYELGGRKSWLEPRIFARLELLGEFEFALGVLGAAKFAVGLAEKVMRDVVVGVHGNRALQSTDRQLRFSFFLQNFAEENIRAGRSRIEPDGALQEFFRFIELLNARIGVGKFVVCDGIAGIYGEFLFELRSGFGNFRLIQVKFA